MTTITDDMIDAEFTAVLAASDVAYTTDRAQFMSNVPALLGKAPEFTWFGSLPAMIDAAKAACELSSAPEFFPGRIFAYWPSELVMCRKSGEITAADPEYAELLALEATIASNVYWIPFDTGDVYACDGPITLAKDDDGNFHSSTGPAIAWADGSAFYAWHGLWIPEAWIMAPETVDPRLALTHQNAEMARCLGEILGWERVLQHASARTLATDPNPLTGGELLEVRLQSGVARFCRVRCGTGRTFVIQVADDARSVIEGVAGTYGLTVEVYAQLQART